jgi:hypothetical protein
MHKKFCLTGLFLRSLFSGLKSWAQDSSRSTQPEMVDTLRSNGKIYVVVAVLSLILLGLFLYLIQLDRKIRNLEKTNRK